MRIEPPPSLACATGNTPAAIAAEEPPDEPPELCARFQGLRVAPNRRDSVVAVWPNSGEVSLAKMFRPAV